MHEIRRILEILQRYEVASGTFSRGVPRHAEHFNSEDSEDFLSLNPNQTSKGSSAGAMAFRYPASWLFRSLTWEKSSMMQCNIRGPNMFLTVCAQIISSHPGKAFFDQSDTRIALFAIADALT